MHLSPAIAVMASRHLSDVQPLQRQSPVSRRFRFKWVLLLLLLLPVGWMGYRTAKSYFTPADAVLVLGGATEREDFAADFARLHPDLPIWVSSGSNPEYTQAVFADAGIDPQRLHLDRAAVDTVTNFTTLVDPLKAQGIRNVYLITSDYHMQRARIIGEIVLGSRDIAVKPIAVPSQQPPESLSKSLRDGARAILWLTTGRTGSTLNHHLKAQ